MSAEFTEEIIKAVAPKTKDLFKPEVMDQIIAKITELAKEHKPDLSTVGSRAEIASVAHKVAGSKSFLEKKGKELVEPIKAQAKVIDAQRKKMRDALDELKKEVRKPLTDWETEQQLKEEAIQKQITYLNGIGNIDIRQIVAGKIIDLIDNVRALAIDGGMGEFTEKAEKFKEGAINLLKEKLVERNQYDAEQAELAELRKMKAEAEEQASKAKEAAEEKERAEAEKQRKAKEEEERKESLKRIEEQARRNAEEKAARDQQIKELREAAKREEERLKEEKRIADISHREEVENAAKDDLAELEFLDVYQAIEVVEMIRDGKIRNVSINY
jgi:hypothetical protein